MNFNYYHINSSIAFYTFDSFSQENFPCGLCKINKYGLDFLMKNSALKIIDNIIVNNPMGIKIKY